MEIRLADVPVVGYLSGGIDSAMVLANASKIRGKGCRFQYRRLALSPKLDETSKASQASRHIDSPQTIVHCDEHVIADAYPKLITAADLCR